MRIALITETFLPNVNGVVTTLCRLLEYCRDHGHEAILFAPHDAPTSFAGAEVVPLYGMPLPFYPELKLTPPQLRIGTHLKRFRPDLVHLAGALMLGPAGTFAARRQGFPLITSYHTNFPSYSAHYGFGLLRELSYNYLRWFHNRCALTLCPSSATLVDLRAHGFRRLRLWARGVDTEQFHPHHHSQSWRTSVGAQPGEQLLLYVGRLALEKRLDLLSVALRGLDGIRLVIVGDGPARPGIERMMAGLPVTFTGYLRGEALATAYASADMFVFPSDSETFGQAIQEAMASGLPVVAARAGGAIDLLSDGVSGLCFTPGNTSELRLQILRLMQSPNLRVALGRSARANAERHTWNTVIGELMGYYQTAQRRQMRLRMLSSSTS